MASGPDQYSPSITGRSTHIWLVRLWMTRLRVSRVRTCVAKWRTCRRVKKCEKERTEIIVTTILEAYHVYSWQELMPLPKKDKLCTVQNKRKNRKTSTVYLGNQQNCKAHKSQFHVQRESKNMCVLDVFLSCIMVYCKYDVTYPDSKGIVYKSCGALHIYLFQGCLRNTTPGQNQLQWLASLDSTTEILRKIK